MLVLLVICLLPGLAAALGSRRFRPDPALVWWRGLLTAAAVLGSGLLVASVAQRWWTIESLGRLAERGGSRRPVLSGWDVFGVTFFALLYLALVLGIVEVEGLGWALLAVGLVAAAARVATLRAGARTGAGASR